MEKRSKTEYLALVYESPARRALQTILFFSCFTVVLGMSCNIISMIKQPYGHLQSWILARVGGYDDNRIS